ncbi:hypothetical protein D3C84_1194180 [compost metagenome]
MRRLVGDSPAVIQLTPLPALIRPGVVGRQLVDGRQGEQHGSEEFAGFGVGRQQPIGLPLLLAQQLASLGNAQ